MYKETEGKLKIGFQFFAESGEGNEGGEGNNQGNEGGQNQQNNQQSQGKTFTQEEVNTMMANEKRTARQALFKALGHEVTDGDFDAATKAIKEVLDAGKTQQQRDKEAAKAAQDAKDEADRKNALLQAQVDVMKAGVKADYVDDAISMLLPKATEEKPLAKLLEEYKEKYPNWYGEPESSTGTGSGTNPARNKGGKPEGIGKRIAQSSKPASKSSYFNN